MYKGLVTSVESGRATLKIMDGLGKAVGNGLGVIGTGVGLKKKRQAVEME